MQIHLLNMGTTMYGDCILVTHGGKTILIDGGHPRDDRSIRDQLKGLLRKPAPFAIDLLVVTHCHSDHIGCLPALVADNVLTAKYALVADEKLGWGRTADGTDAVDTHNLTDAQKALAFAALEEDHSDLAPSALADFLEDVVKLRPRYVKMLQGGFDVVPAHRLDVLDAATRQKLQAKGDVGRDADRFIVWSDELYGDRDGDFLPEVPVTRIPDGRLGDVVFGALQASFFRPGQRFGVRNVYREFAAGVFEKVPPSKGGKLEVSQVFRPALCEPGAAAGAVYLMLHGDHEDASRFWGESAPQVMYEAFAVRNVPAVAPGTVVFAGCCWGALAMAPPAGLSEPGAPLQARSPESSIPLAYLRAGALAFVGCTGSHYSPDESQPEPNFLGKPMHDAFWDEVAAGHGPAEALFRAKKTYLRGMPHGLTDPFDKAAETKILRQFTCLGLGW